VKPGRSLLSVTWLVDREGRSGGKEETVKRLALITLIVGSALAIVPVATSQVLSEAGGGGVGGLSTAPSSTDPATQAVLLRSQALAKHYVDPATQAVLLRSKGLSNDYGANGVNLHTDVLGGTGGSSSAPIAAGGDSVEWNTVLAATLAGMLILALAATLVTRRKHEPSF
jgi:hypothetical protein